MFSVSCYTVFTVFYLNNFKFFFLQEEPDNHRKRKRKGRRNNNSNGDSNAQIETTNSIGDQPQVIAKGPVFMVEVENVHHKPYEIGEEMKVILKEFY